MHNGVECDTWFMHVANVKLLVHISPPKTRGEDWHCGSDHAPLDVLRTQWPKSCSHRASVLPNRIFTRLNIEQTRPHHHRTCQVPQPTCFWKWGGGAPTSQTPYSRALVSRAPDSQAQLVDRLTQLICISDIYWSTDKYKRPTSWSPNWFVFLISM